MSARHPPLAARLLRVCAGQAWDESIAGDLEEIHRRRGRDGSPWRWRAVAPIALAFALERTRRRLRDLTDATPLPRRGGDGMIQGLWRDARFALRSMRRSPVFTLAAGATLALGIGASASLYSFVNAFLLRPLPFEAPERLVHVWSTDRPRGDATLRSSLPDARAWRESSRSLEDLALFNYTEANVTEFERPERLPVGLVSANAFAVLGREPVLGRSFVAGEDAPGAAPVAVLSHGFWLGRFGGSRDVLGRTIELDERRFEVVGVMPPDFAFPLNTTQLWRPYALDETRYDRTYTGFQVVARLREGVSRAEAQAELDGIARALERDYPDSNDGRGVSLVPLRDALNFASELMDPMAALLTVAVAFVLLITCANIASLLLGRAVARDRELAVRSALGAGRGRVIRQLLTESTLLSLVGAALGLPVARLVLRWMDSSIPLELYRVGALALDAAGVAVAVGVALVAALGFGALPAIQATRGDLVASLKEGGRGAGSRRASRSHAVLAVAQVGTAFVLLICAALVARSLSGMRDVPLGFDGEALTAQLILTSDRYTEPDAKRAFQRRVIEELRATPGVSSAAIVNYLPLNHETSMRGYLAAETERDSDAPPPRAIDVSVTPGYFDTMGIPLLQGRDFSDGDDAAAPAVVIVNRALAEAAWPGESPVGRELLLFERNDESVATVVGVVADARHMSLADPPERMLYFPQYQDPWRYMRVLMRGETERAAAEAAMRHVVARVDPTLPVTEVRTMARVASDFLIPQRMLAGALMVLGGAALLLAVVGIYGVLAQQVASRTREIGVRMALGATRPAVLALVLRRGLTLTAVGGALGITGSLLTARLLEAFVFGLSTTDVTTLVGVSAALGSTALLACVAPALRAARVDPLEALRYE